MDFLIGAVGQATLVSKCVLVILLVMSLISWAYMGGKWFTLRSARRRCGKPARWFTPLYVEMAFSQHGGNE